MIYSIRNFTFFLTTSLLFSLIAHAQNNLDSLSERVRSFSAAYVEQLSNIHCKFESTESNGVKHHGQIAILNRVLPYKFPPQGAYSFSRFVAADSPSHEDSLSMKIGNPQYSFRIKKLSQSQNYSLHDVVVPIDDPGRNDLSKDNIFFSFSSTDAEAIWAPIRVFDLASIDLLSGDRGVQITNSQYSSKERHTVVEFKFPKDHPFKHEWARVIFGDRGEVLEYEIRNRPLPDVVVTYFVKNNYPVFDQTNESHLFPSEFRFRSTTSREGQKLPDSGELSVRLSDFEFNKNEMSQFTLTHYGIPEPEGTTVLGRPVPYWLWGTVAGGVFLAIGMYLRRKANRTE